MYFIEKSSYHFSVIRNSSTRHIWRITVGLLKNTLESIVQAIRLLCWNRLMDRSLNLICISLWNRIHWVTDYVYTLKYHTQNVLTNQAIAPFNEHEHKLLKKYTRGCIEYKNIITKHSNLAWTRSQLVFHIMKSIEWRFKLINSSRCKQISQPKNKY